MAHESLNDKIMKLTETIDEIVRILKIVYPNEDEEEEKQEYVNASITFIVSKIENKIKLKTIASNDFIIQYDDFETMCKFVVEKSTLRFEEINSETFIHERFKTSDTMYYISIIETSNFR